MNAVNVFDFETTDTDPSACGVIQASVVCVYPVKDAAGYDYNIEFNEIMIPARAISKEASDVHGWTIEKLQAQDHPLEYVKMQQLCNGIARLDSKEIWCGYNSDRFDGTILRRWMEHFHGKGSLEQKLDMFDLMNYLLRHHTLDSYKLGEAYNHFFDDYDSEQAHEAAYDCVMVGRLIHKLVPDLEQAVEEMKTPQPIAIMPFGKHAGKPFYSLPRHYMRYILKLDINADVRCSMEQELSKRPGR